MGSLLVRVGLWIVSGLVARLLFSVGIGLSAQYAVSESATHFINYAIASFNSIGGFIGLFGLAGVDKSLSIFIGAVSFRATYNALKLVFFQNS